MPSRNETDPIALAPKAKPPAASWWIPRSRESRAEWYDRARIEFETRLIGQDSASPCIDDALMPKRRAW